MASPDCFSLAAVQDLRHVYEERRAASPPQAGRPTKVAFRDPAARGGHSPRRRSAIAIDDEIAEVVLTAGVRTIRRATQTPSAASSKGDGDPFTLRTHQREAVCYGVHSAAAIVPLSDGGLAVGANAGDPTTLIEEARAVRLVGGRVRW
jgi:hypothetical protein